MKKNFVLTIITSLCMIALLAASLTSSTPVDAASSLQGGGPNQPENTAPVIENGVMAVSPTGQMSYQGRLVISGVPYTGTLNMTFKLYQAASGGTDVWNEVQSVSVTNGLFSVMLGASSPLTPKVTYFASQLWLGVKPAGAAAELTPRQPLGAAAYAYGLIPGTTILDTSAAGGFNYAFYLSTDNHQGIYSHTGLASSVGVDAYTTGANSRGVQGISTGAGGVGVYGLNNNGSNLDADNGVKGEVTTGQGVGVFGLKDGSSGMGVSGVNVGTSGSGTSGKSTNYIGLWGETSLASNNYGLYTPDNIHSLNYSLTGAIMQVVQNGGTEPIEPGDVVVFSGLGEPMKNGVLTIQVARATSANSTAVAGVAYSRFNVAAVDGSFTASGPADGFSAETTLPGAAETGDYLLLVVQGPAQVNVSALNGAIEAGDLLSTGASKGTAGRATEVDFGGVKMTVPGTVFGKALEALDSGSKLIYVYVTLQ